jgi:hypothetical protein
VRGFKIDDIDAPSRLMARSGEGEIKVLLEPLLREGGPGTEEERANPNHRRNSVTRPIPQREASALGRHGGNRRSEVAKEFQPDAIRLNTGYGTDAARLQKGFKVPTST